MMKRLGLDVFGTLDTYPDIFKELLPWVRQHQQIGVFVVGGPRPEDTEKILHGKGYKHGVHYDGIESVLSYLSKHMHPLVYDPVSDRFKAKKQQDWWASKAKICETLQISTHIDNESRFAPYFISTPVRFVYFNSTSIREFYRIIRHINSA